MFSRQRSSRILLLQAALLAVLSQPIASTQAQAQGHGTNTPISILQPLRQSQVTLTKATTPDAKTVVVAYAVLGSKANSIHFDLYRSEASNATTNAILSQDDTTPADLTIGEHTVSFAPNAGLPPNTALPYVVVVATSDGQKSTVYFRKFLIGVIAHGFDRWAFANTLSAVTLVSIPVWETAMARSLKSLDRYDDVIAFNWTQTCTLPRPDMAVQAGHRLAAEVVAKSAIRSQHPGDVVDFHFIGHSRGAVVVTEAIKDMAIKDPLLGGSFVEVTLLDPHPANTCFTANCPTSDLPDLSNPASSNPSPADPDPSWASFAKDSRNQPTTAAQIVRMRATLPAKGSRPSSIHSPGSQKSRGVVSTHAGKLLQPTRSGIPNESMGHGRLARTHRSKRSPHQTHRQDQLRRSHRPQPNARPLPDPDSRNRQSQSRRSLTGRELKNSNSPPTVTNPPANVTNPPVNITSSPINIIDLPFYITRTKTASVEIAPASLPQPIIRIGPLRLNRRDNPSELPHNSTQLTLGIPQS